MNVCSSKVVRQIISSWLWVVKEYLLNEFFGRDFIQKIHTESVCWRLRWFLVIISMYNHTVYLPFILEKPFHHFSYKSSTLQLRITFSGPSDLILAWKRSGGCTFCVGLLSSHPLQSVMTKHLFSRHFLSIYSSGLAFSSSGASVFTIQPEFVVLEKSIHPETKMGKNTCSTIESSYINTPMGLDSHQQCLAFPGLTEDCLFYIFTIFNLFYVIFWYLEEGWNTSKCLTRSVAMWLPLCHLSAHVIR